MSVAPVKGPRGREWHTRGDPYEGSACYGHDPRLWEVDPYERGAKASGDYKLMVAWHAKAVSICNACPIRDWCLTDSTFGERWEWHTRGGLTETQRMELLSERKRKQARAYRA